jgi:dipeptidase E
VSTRIVAIGGGRVRGGEGDVTTTLIDEIIVEASRRKPPRLLFLPTASLDDESYCEAIERQFGQRLGCRVSPLLLIRESLTPRTLARRLGQADIIYVGGGNTLRMMNLWRRLGVDVLLERARSRGCVLAGVSAGAICWFSYGNSDSRKFANPVDSTLIRVTGLGMVDALLCPHYDSERHRKASLKTMMQRTPGVAIALEDNAAIEIRNDEYRIIASQPGKLAYRVYAHAGRVRRDTLTPTRMYLPLADLLCPPDY